MLRILLRVLGALMLLAMLLVPLVASAHQTITDGDYDIEYGWVNEPVIINQPNAVVINITKHQAADTSASGTVTSTTTTTDTTAAPAAVDVSGLVIEASYGGQTKTLALQPLAENTPGQFVAPMMPTVAGQYTIQLSGKIDGKDIKTIQVQPEEAQLPDVVAFPKAVPSATKAGLSTSAWLALGGLAFGLIGTALGVVALMRKH